MTLSRNLLRFHRGSFTKSRIWHESSWEISNPAWAYNYKVIIKNIIRRKDYNYFWIPFLENIIDGVYIKQVNLIYICSVLKINIKFICIGMLK
jgi:hypothetical protein